jgi:KaiC/GvpD/RAD55 family RecA-like ATPase
MAHLYNAELEQKLLICALETRSETVRAMVLAETEEDTYGSEYGQLVRKRMNALLRAGKSFGTARDFASDAAISSSKGAVAFLQATPEKRRAAGKFSKKRVADLIQKLKTYEQVRAIYGIQAEVNTLAEGNVSDEEIDQIRSAWERGLNELHGGYEKQTLVHFGNRSTLQEARREYEELMTYNPAQFVSSGMDGLDKHLHGFERGNLVTVSAPRGGGKSAFAMQMAINQYLKSNHNVCYVSIEMTKREFLRRVVSNISQVPHDKVRVTKYMTKEERKATEVAFQQWQKHGSNNNCGFTLWPVKDPKFTPQKVEATTAPLMYDVIVIDYITLMHAQSHQSTWQMQMEYSRYLAMMAKKLNCVIVLLSQLSEDERVKYGKAIEENTDYWMWWPYGPEEEASGNVELRLAKARHVRPTRLPARFMLDIMRIETAVAQTTQKGGRSTGAVSADSEIWTNSGG